MHLDRERLFKILSHEKLIVHQLKEWVEVFVDIETVNRYEILDINSTKIGMILEKGGGAFTWLKRIILRSHRPLDIGVYDSAGLELMKFKREFFWIFSDLLVLNSDDRRLGSIHRRFGLINKKYDLYDSSGRHFASIKSPIWRLWTFPILDQFGSQVGVITKRWQGILRETFTDADSYLLDFSRHTWSAEQKAVILAASISVDFDFFENNQGKRDGLLGGIGIGAGGFRGSD